MHSQERPKSGVTHTRKSREEVRALLADLRKQLDQGEKK